MAKQSITRNDYFRSLNLDKDPFQNSYTEAAFFITPELQHRLDLIKHLLEFSQQILLVKGAAKVGKTNFCQHLIVKAEAEWIICSIDATEDMGPDTLVKAMLHDHQDKLEDTTETIAALNRYLEFCNLNNSVPVLFVDNADKLNQASLRFIFQLMEFKEQDTFVRVLLIGQDLLLQRLNEIAEELSNAGLVHAVSIPAFTLEQTAAYLRHRLSACGGREDMFSEKEASRIHKVAGGLAGDINFLARQGLSDPAELEAELATAREILKTNKNSSQIGKLILASLLVTFIVFGSWSFLQEDGKTDTKTVPLNLPPENLPVPALTVNETIPKKPEPLPDAWLESQVALPESVEAVESFPDEVESEKESNIEDKEKIPVAKAVKKSTSVDIKPQPELQTLPATTSRGKPGPGKIKSNDWLLAQPADRYVLQLMGAVEKATITRFLEDAQLDKEQLALYKTKQSGKDWHVLVYGLYPDREQARAAIDALSAKARAQKPWPKAIISIQKVLKSP
jgi:DamX protein